MIYDNVGKVIEEPFESLLNRYQIGLEKLMRGSDFWSCSFDLGACLFNFVVKMWSKLYYKCDKINLNWSWSYRVTLWLKKKQRKKQQ